MAKTKPVLFPEDYRVERFNPRDRQAADPSRIEGHSEIVQANDIERADAYEFKKAHETSKGVKTKEDAFRVIGARPQQLPVEFKWLRVCGPGGAYSASASAEIDVYASDQGFIPCTKERFDVLTQNFGYKFNSNRWWVAEDGTIRRGYDTALFYRSGEVARDWERAMAEETAKREGAAFPESLRDTETFREEETEEVFLTH